MPMQTRGAHESSRSKAEWTLQDIVAAPEIVDLSISADGRRAMYIVRRGNLQMDTKISNLHIVDLASGTDRDLKSSSWLDKLQVIPGSRDWSVLADLGEGVQLYRVDGGGHFTAMLVNRQLDRIGGPEDGQVSFGVSDYGWAPDGKTFWYEKRTTIESLDDRAVDPPSLPLRNWYGSSPIQLRVRTGGGQDVLLETSDAVAGGYFGVEWNDTSSSMSFWIRDSDTRELKQRQWSRGNNEAKVVVVEPEFYVPTSKAHGLHGGTIKTTGLGNARKLVEVGKDGSVIEYGSVGFQLGDPRASGNWISPDREVALAGTRYIDVPRYGLARIKRSGEVVELTGANASLTHCSISEDFTAGVCVRQSMVSPPTLVRFDPRNGGVKEVESLAPHHAAIEPLKVVPRIWTNRDGYKASGFVVYPRNYRKGQKYPAILVTHGSDADEMFVNQALQWEYPVQVWAEQGYLVIAMNDPTVSGSKDLQTAFAQWGGSKPGPLSIDRLQDLAWINGAWSFEDAVKELAAEGLVDTDRVGIAGYSRGSQMVNVTMTQSKMFHAASSGDGGYLEPHGYFVATRSYRQVFGGSPFDPAAAPNYQRLSPTFRAAKAAGPILQQVALGSASQQALHVALREAGIPSELVYYPNESHLFHQPKHRLAAMQENLDWFDFWLLGKEDPDPAKAQQYKRWRAMRDSQRDSNGGHGVQGTPASGGSG
jgi:dipeptidyl aminopeptidase/acylaminoacyl peptidase